MKVVLFSMAALFFLQGLNAQVDKKYVGTYQSAQADLKIAVFKTTETSFDIHLLAEGQFYKGTASPTFGILMGTYDYQGNPIGFSISKILGQYLITSDGVDIALERTSEVPSDLSKLAKKPTTTSTSPSNTTTSGNETTVSKQYKQRIAGKRLLYLYTGNGYSEKWHYDLCSNGTFYFYANSSYLSGDFSGVTQSDDAGNWQVFTRGNQTILRLTSQKNGTKEFALTNRADASELNLNNNRYFITKNESCP